jgi:hypothetical protein
MGPRQTPPLAGGISITCWPLVLLRDRLIGFTLQAS